MLYVILAFLFTLQRLHADDSYENARASLKRKLERIESLEHKVAVLKLVNAKEKSKVLGLLDSVRNHESKVSNFSMAIKTKTSSKNVATQKGKSFLHSVKYANQWSFKLVMW